MKKEMIMRGLLGFPARYGAGEAIAIAGSLVWEGDIMHHAILSLCKQWEVRAMRLRCRLFYADGSARYVRWLPLFWRFGDGVS